MRLLTRSGFCVGNTACNNLAAVLDDFPIPATVFVVGHNAEFNVFHQLSPSARNDYQGELEHSLPCRGQSCQARRLSAGLEVAKLAKRPGGCNDHGSRWNGKPQAWDFRVRAAVTALQVHANLGGEQGAGRAKTTTRVDGNYDQGSAAQQQARAAMKLATI